MTYVQALFGGGGWPLNVFLSPDLRPLMGGTYFPPDDKFGRPGFKTILRCTPIICFMLRNAPSFYMVCSLIIYFCVSAQEGEGSLGN